MQSHYSALIAPDANNLPSVDEDEIDKILKQNDPILAANLAFSPLPSNSLVIVIPDSPTSEGESYDKQNSLASLKTKPIGTNTNGQIVKVAASTNSAPSIATNVIDLDALWEEELASFVDATAAGSKCTAVDVTKDGSPTVRSSSDSAPPVLVTYRSDHFTLFAPLFPSPPYLTHHAPLLAGHDTLYSAPLSDLMRALCSEIAAGDNEVEVVLQWPEMRLEVSQELVEAGRFSMEDVAKVHERLTRERPMSLVVSVREKVRARIKRLWGLVEERRIDGELNSGGTEDGCNQRVGEWVAAQKMGSVAEQRAVRDGPKFSMSLSDDLCIGAELMSYEEAFGIEENNVEEEVKQVCKRHHGKEENLAQSGLEESEKVKTGKRFRSERFLSRSRAWSDRGL